MHRFFRPVLQFVEHTSDQWQGRTPVGAKRSSEWDQVRDEWLAEHPTCACCGGKSKLRVHHIIPFWVREDLELEPTNLITLCEAKKFGINCHFLVGHYGNWKRWNPAVEFHAQVWHLRLNEGVEYYVKRFVEYAAEAKRMSSEGPAIADLPDNFPHEFAAQTAAVRKAASEMMESHGCPGRNSRLMPGSAEDCDYCLPHDLGIKKNAIQKCAPQLAAFARRVEAEREARR